MGSLHAGISFKKPTCCLLRSCCASSSLNSESMCGLRVHTGSLEWNQLRGNGHMFIQSETGARSEKGKRAARRSRQAGVKPVFLESRSPVDARAGKKSQKRA